MHIAALVTIATVASVASVATAESESFDLATSFATKSSYWDQHNDPLAHTKSLSDKEAAKYTLVHVQNVVRHGTRFPTKGNTIEIQNLLAKLQSNYGMVIPAWMQSYKLPYNVSVEGELAPAGTNEANAFGARTRKRIGASLPEQYSTDKFLVEHTFKPRTKDTAKGFVSSFFSNPADVTFVEHSKKSDVLFRFFDDCPRYTSEIAENTSALAELTAFRASSGFQQQVESLRTALNLPANANLTALDVDTACSACAFDLALYKTRDAWCTLLSKEVVQACDFADDLDVFVENSAGAKISYEISAVLLRDIYNSWMSFAQHNSSIVGHLRFVHAETVLPLMTLLGFADKTPLTANYTTKQIQHRKFRSSRLSPFMGNLEFGLYTKNSKKQQCARQTDCNEDSDAEDDDAATKYYVQIRLNEQVVAVPGCDGKFFCNLEKFEKIWNYYLHDYDFTAACAV